MALAELYDSVAGLTGSALSHRARRRGRWRRRRTPGTGADEHEALGRAPERSTLVEQVALREARYRRHSPAPRCAGPSICPTGSGAEVHGEIRFCRTNAYCTGSSGGPIRARRRRGSSCARPRLRLVSEDERNLRATPRRSAPCPIFLDDAACPSRCGRPAPVRKKGTHNGAADSGLGSGAAELVPASGRRLEDGARQRAPPRRAIRDEGGVDALRLPTRSAWRSPADLER